MRVSKILGVFLAFLLLGSVSSAQAVTIGLTLAADKDLATIGNGELVTFTVGITPATTITGYTLDILIDSNELIYQSAQELMVNLPTLFPFVVDPGDGLLSSNTGRASLILVSDIASTTDLFSLTFMTGPVVGDGLADITIGILDSTADDINPPVGDDPFTITPDVVSASVGAAIPEPASLMLIGTGLVGLIGFARKRS